jgi:hypothetical protein
MIPTTPNNQILIEIWYSYLSSQLFIIHHATGIARKKAIPISFKNSRETSNKTCGTDAPSTLRIPISLIRFSTVKETNPASPRQQIKMASAAKILVILLMSSSVANFFPNSFELVFERRGYIFEYRFVTK